MKAFTISNQDLQKFALSLQKFAEVSKITADISFKLVNHMTSQEYGSRYLYRDDQMAKRVKLTTEH